MPAEWGKAGGRFPLRIDVDISPLPSAADEGGLLIKPRAPLVRYTDFIDPWRKQTGEKVCTTVIHDYDHRP